MRLKDRVALITGAASGIGAQTARRFAAEGARVICADRNKAGAEDVAAEIARGGGRAWGAYVDVRDAAAVRSLVQQAVGRESRIDVLVNNAGVTIVGAVETLSDEEWDTELDVNLKSIFRLSREVWPIMKAQGSGVILNTASIAGLIAIPADAAYCASKAGVVMLTKCMAVDGAKLGIRVNCVCPGFIDTPMIKGYFEAQSDPAAARAFAAGMHPLGTLGHPEDIASAFAYLASDDAKWVTGTALVADGGLTCSLPPG